MECVWIASNGAPDWTDFSGEGTMKTDKTAEEKDREELERLREKGRWHTEHARKLLAELTKGMELPKPPEGKT
jgi:hypothetical protein